MTSKDSQGRHTTLSRFQHAILIINYLKRSGDFDLCEKNPNFPLARAMMLDACMREVIVDASNKLVRA